MEAIYASFDYGANLSGCMTPEVKELKKGKRKSKVDDRGFLVECDLCSKKFLLNGFLFHRNQCVQKLHTLVVVSASSSSSCGNAISVKGKFFHPAFLVFNGDGERIKAMSTTLRSAKRSFVGSLTIATLSIRGVLLDFFKKQPPKNDKYDARKIYGPNSRKRKELELKASQDEQRNHQVETLCKYAENGDLEGLKSLLPAKKKPPFQVPSRATTPTTTFKPSSRPPKHKRPSPYAPPLPSKPKRPIRRKRSHEGLLGVTAAYKNHQTNKYNLLRGHFESVKFLVEYKANVNARTRGGMCAMHFSTGHPKIIQYLRKHGGRKGKGKPTAVCTTTTTTTTTTTYENKIQINVTQKKAQSTRYKMGLHGAPPLGGLTGLDGTRGTLPTVAPSLHHRIRKSRNIYTDGISYPLAPGRDTHRLIFSQTPTETPRIMCQVPIDNSRRDITASLPDSAAAIPLSVLNFPTSPKSGVTTGRRPLTGASSMRGGCKDSGRSFAGGGRGDLAAFEKKFRKKCLQKEEEEKGEGKEEKEEEEEEKETIRGKLNEDHQQYVDH
eukprot:jgi/Bigna1/81683/fgenesh1_pg.83_\